MKKIILKCADASTEILPHRGALVSKLEFPEAGSILWLPENFESNDSTWPGGGLPFLFPFAGRVQHAGELYKYAIEDQVFSMPLHGFSWSMPWETLEVLPSQTKLQLRSSDATYALYPFEFTLNMDVRLEARALFITVEMTNLGRLPQSPLEKMPVAIGWHPYFALKSQPTYLDVKAKKLFPVTSQGLAGSPVPTKGHLGDPPWALPDPKINNLIFGELEVSTASLRTPQSQLKMACKPDGLINHIVTWSNITEEFLCVEPWMSLPDAINVPSGCRWLSTGESLKIHLIISPSLSVSRLS